MITTVNCDLSLQLTRLLVYLSTRLLVNYQCARFNAAE